MERMMKCVSHMFRVALCSSALTAFCSAGLDPVSAEPLVIAAAPSVKAPLEALAQAFERAHPDVRIQIHYDSGGGVRQSIASMQNTGRYSIGSGPVHLIAPSSSEVLDRLEQRYYVLPGTRKAYASVPLTLVVPESQVDTPSSFEAFAQDATKKLSVADPGVTELGLRTQSFLAAAGLSQALQGRLDVAHDAKGVIDDVMNGDADAGIVFGSDAIRHAGRVRIVASSTDTVHRPVVYFMAMERFCPNRNLCRQFLDFTQTEEAQKALKPLGYGSPSHRARSAQSP